MLFLNTPKAFMADMKMAAAWMSMEVIVTIVSKLVDFTYLRDLQPTYIGVITHPVIHPVPAGHPSIFMGGLLDPIRFFTTKNIPQPSHPPGPTFWTKPAGSQAYKGAMAPASPLGP